MPEQASAMGIWLAVLADGCAQKQVTSHYYYNYFMKGLKKKKQIRENKNSCVYEYVLLTYFM